MEGRTRPSRLGSLLRPPRRGSLGLGCCSARPGAPPLPQLGSSSHGSFLQPCEAMPAAGRGASEAPSSARVWEGALNAAPRFRSSELV